MLFTNAQIIKRGINHELSLINSFVYGVNSGKPDIFSIKHTYCAECHARSHWISAYHSAMLVIGGWSISSAIILPSGLILGSGIFAFLIFAKEISQSEILSIFSLILYLNCSGVGWIKWFFADSRYLMNTDYVNNWGNGTHTRWIHPIFEYLLADRFNQYVFALCSAALILVHKEYEKRKMMVIGGILGILPALDHRAFFSLLFYIIAQSTWTFIHFERSKYPKIIRSLRYLILSFAIIGVVPLINMRTIGFEEKLFKFSVYWKQFSDNGYFYPFITSWTFDLGVFFLLSFFGTWFITDRRQKRYFWPSLVVFIAGNFISFSDYGPASAFYFMPTWAMTSSVLIIVMMDKTISLIANAEIRGVVLAVWIFFYLSMIMSSILGLSRNIRYHSASWADSDEIVAQYIIKNTPTDSIFIAPTNDFNPVSTLAGRRLLALNDISLLTYGFIQSPYKSKLMELRKNPDLPLLLFINYVLEHDRINLDEHLNFSSGEHSWKVCYGFESYQLYNRTK